MLKTLWTVTAAGLFAVCMSGCGGGSDPVTDACNKANSCNLLATMGYSSVSACVSDGKASVNASPQKSTIENEISACLKQSDCNVFAACIQALGGP
jgi:hypothetical protein